MKIYPNDPTISSYKLDKIIIFRCLLKFHFIPEIKFWNTEFHLVKSCFTKNELHQWIEIVSQTTSVVCRQWIFIRPLCTYTLASKTQNGTTGGHYAARVSTRSMKTIKEALFPPHIIYCFVSSMLFILKFLSFKKITFLQLSYLLPFKLKYNQTQKFDKYPKWSYLQTQNFQDHRWSMIHPPPKPKYQPSKIQITFKVRQIFYTFWSRKASRSSRGSLIIYLYMQGQIFVEQSSKYI